jgi:hypothetical protein
MPTVATGPAPALFVSSARQGVDARAANRAISLKARRALCDLQPWNPKEGSGYVPGCTAPHVVKTNLLFLQLKLSTGGASIVASPA